MIEPELYQDEPKGLPQEAFGADVVEGCTHTALDHFIESKNAGMGPIVNAQGVAMLYADNAVLEAELPSPDGGLMKAHLTGRAEIERFFEALSLLMKSIVNIEADRSVTGRTAVWTGRIQGVQGQSRKKQEFDAVYRLEFDEHDHVLHQWSRYKVRREG